MSYNVSGTFNITIGFVFKTNDKYKIHSHWSQRLLLPAENDT